MNITSREFCYWLQGYFEINNDVKRLTLDANQVDMIQKHLKLVFRHEIDPSYGPESVQEELNQIHQGSTCNPNVTQHTTLRC